MSDPTRAATDRAVEQLVGRLLQLGVLIAAAVVLIGAALLLSHGTGPHRAYNVFRGEPAVLRSLTGIARGAMAGQPLAIVQLGLVLLIATPVARVALTLVAFVVQRDRTYVVITTIVLALLLFGLIFGGA